MSITNDYNELQKFATNLIQTIEWPFKFSDVENIEENCGSTWIKLKNGDVYFINIEKCELDEEN